MLDSVLLWIEKNKRTWLADLKQFLSIASVSAQSQHDADTAAAAEWASDYLRGIGMESRLLPTPRHACVLATTPADFAPAGAPHILFYGHYDVQPAEPFDQWQSAPFSPEIRDHKLFARGASDDKGQVFCHLAALAAWRDIAHQLPVRLTVLLEGEEEIGSPNLRGVLAAHAGLLRTARTVVISDSDQFAPGVPAITYGLRGLAYVQVNVQGPRSDLHSGLYGGAVANPANALARVLAQLHDDAGRVTIPGFYDDVDPLDPRERQEWANLPFNEAAFAAELQVNALAGETGYTALERRWARPTLDINGLTAGYQGAGAKTVLPAAASAKVSMRLVPRQDPGQIIDAFEAHVRKLLPPGVTVTFDRFGGSPAALTPLDSPAMRAAAAAMETGFGKRPVFVRGGGSIPVVGWVKETLGLDCVLVGFGLPSDGIHGPNEKFDLDCFYNGMRTAAALYDRLAAAYSG